MEHTHMAIADESMTQEGMGTPQTLHQEGATLLRQNPGSTRDYAERVKQRALHQLYGKLQGLYASYNAAIRELDDQYGLTASRGRLPLALLDSYATQLHTLFLRLDEQTQEAWREYGATCNAWDGLCHAAQA